MEMNYCRRCGQQLTHQAGTRFTCPNEHEIFDNPSTCVGIFLVDSDKNVVLAVRGVEPHKGMLDSIGGFVEPKETLEQAVYRELHEEVDIEKDQIGELHYLTSGVGHYPYNGEAFSLATVFYWAALPAGLDLKVQDDIEALRTIKIADVNPDELHDDDIRTGIAALKQAIL